MTWRTGGCPDGSIRKKRIIAGGQSWEPLDYYKPLAKGGGRIERRAHKTAIAKTVIAKQPSQVTAIPKNDNAFCKEGREPDNEQST